MNLVDSCGWLEFFADAPNAENYLPAIKDSKNLLVPTICILEVFKKLLKQWDMDDALKAVPVMQTGHVVELDTRTALNAAKISIELNLPLADSVILATARTHNAVVWTQDAHFKDIKGVKYFGEKGWRKGVTVPT